MNIKDGDFVLLREDSVFYSRGVKGGINPADTIGEVLQANNGNEYLNLRITVRWSNGCENCYNERDLRLV